ncbi:Fc.00g083270.m01.CDS01 [Cosmosporella sp. VM-42]
MAPMNPAGMETTSTHPWTVIALCNKPRYRLRLRYLIHDMVHYGVDSAARARLDDALSKDSFALGLPYFTRREAVLVKTARVKTGNDMPIQKIGEFLSGIESFLGVAGQRKPRELLRAARIYAGLFGIKEGEVKKEVLKARPEPETRVERQRRRVCLRGNRQSRDPPRNLGYIFISS